MEERRVAKPMEVTDETFEQEVLQAPMPVLVDFWAPWCGPCRAMAPVLEELASKHEGHLKVVKVNIDDHQQHAAQNRVMILPTLVLFKDGQAVDRLQGGVPRKLIDGLVAPHVGDAVAS
jgi:thioredoxin 1